MYGSPPVHGVLLVSTILSDPESKALWVKEVKVMNTLMSFFLVHFFPLPFGVATDMPLMMT